MDLAGAAAITSGMGLKEKLDRAMAYALAHFIYTPDQDRYGTIEHWVTREEIEADLRPAGGRLRKDCDGFAMLCRFILNDAGVPNRLVTCNVRQPPPNGHAVLEVGGWILDCRMNVVVARDQLNYEWVAISGENAGDPWKEIV